VRNLTKRFGTFTAVDDVTFEVRRGEILGYLGPNGSGKTTTLRMMLGLLLPSEGEVTLLGFGVRRQAEAVRARVGYMSQKFALYDELTALENLSFYAGVYGVTDPARLREVIEAVGLTGIESVPAGRLPIGWRQRLALATAIVHQPTLLILDEPTSGVDPLARRAFWDLIYSLAERGVTAFVTTHYMDEAEYCHRVGIMRRGRLLAMDSPLQLKRSALAGSAWDVRADPMLEALETLQALPFVDRAGLAGDHLRAITAAPDQEAALRRALEGRGLTVASVAPAEPSLEDVFLTLASD
jgi:ABC-2 type transport system ATP-binding protein